MLRFTDSAAYTSNLLHSLTTLSKSKPDQTEAEEAWTHGSNDFFCCITQRAGNGLSFESFAAYAIHVHMLQCLAST